MSLDVTSQKLFVQSSRTPTSHSGLENNSNSLPLVIGQNTTLTGILRVDGELRVDGRIDADVRCHALVVGFYGHINGVIVANHVEVFGSITGEVYANKIVIKNGAHVEAELNYQSLKIESGGYFDGRSRRRKDPIGMSPNFTTA